MKNLVKIDAEFIYSFDQDSRKHIYRDLENLLIYCEFEKKKNFFLLKKNLNEFVISM